MAGKSQIIRLIAARRLFSLHSWLASSLVHTGLLVGIAFLTVVGSGPSGDGQGGLVVHVADQESSSSSPFLELKPDLTGAGGTNDIAGEELLPSAPPAFTSSLEISSELDSSVVLPMPPSEEVSQRELNNIRLASSVESSLPDIIHSQDQSSEESLAIPDDAKLAAAISAKFNRKNKKNGKGKNGIAQASLKGDKAGEGVGKGDGEGVGDGSSSGTDSSGSSSKGASFFGSYAHGKRFVFIVDSSSSMIGLRWQTATDELLRAINDLPTGTEFFVICFDYTAHPVFNMYPPNNQFLLNDEPTFVRVQNWIRSFRTGPETWPSKALQMAIQMQPDAIFLLSDGVIRDNSITVLRAINHSQDTSEPIVPIHTILLLSPMGQVPLETIAVENGGTFRNVTLEELMNAAR